MLKNYHKCVRFNMGLSIIETNVKRQTIIVLEKTENEFTA